MEEIQPSDKRLDLMNLKIAVQPLKYSDLLPAVYLWLVHKKLEPVTQSGRASAVLVSPGSMLEVRSLAATLDLLNQNLSKWSSGIHFQAHQEILLSSNR